MSGGGHGCLCLQTDPDRPTIGAIERVVSGKEMEIAETGPERASACHTFDPNVALEYVEGDEQMLCRLIPSFFEEYQQDLVAIETAVRDSDAPGLAAAAHTMKGPAKMFGLVTVIALSEELETLGKSGDLGGAEEAYANLVEEIASGVVALRAWAAATEDRQL